MLLGYILYCMSLVVHLKMALRLWNGKNYCWIWQMDLCLLTQVLYVHTPVKCLPSPQWGSGSGGLRESCQCFCGEENTTDTRHARWLLTLGSVFCVTPAASTLDGLDKSYKTTTE